MFLGTKQVGSKANFPNSSPSLVWKRARFDEVRRSGIKEYRRERCVPACHVTKLNDLYTSQVILYSIMLR